MKKTIALPLFFFSAIFLTYGQSDDARRLTSAQVPLSFEQNAGQTDSAVRFLSRSASAALFVKPDGMTLALASPSTTDGGRGGRDIHAVAMRLAGSSANSSVVGEDELAGRSNYFIGSEPSAWRRDIPHYRRVRVKDAWPGVDTVYYSTEAREYEFDFVVAPAGDPNQIELEFEGAEHVGIDAEGSLSIFLGGRILQWKKPVAYQEVNGRRVEVAANYFRPVDTTGRIKISLGHYDRGRELVIDPVIVYSTFLGGAGADFSQGIAVNAAGETYITGRTFSIDFPVLSPLPGGTVYKNSEEVFVTKLNAAGTAIVFSSFIGGHGTDGGNDIAVDASGNVYIAGRTVSRDFPVTPGAKQTVFGGGNFDGFALKMGPAGNTLIYSTFLGGPNFDEARSIAVDPAGNAYVVGETEDAVGFLTVMGGFQGQPGGGSDGFLVKLHPVSGATVYETFWGTAAYDALRDVTVNAAGEAFIAGQTFTVHSEAGLSTVNAPPVFRPVKGNAAETVITKVSADGAARIWATYFGGNDGFTDVFGIDLDGAGNVYFAGTTTTPNLPVTPGAPKSTLSPGGGQHDGYVAKLNSAGTALLYATYLGGNSYDSVRRLAVVNNRATVVGHTSSANLAMVNPLTGQFSGMAANTAVSNAGGTTWSTPATPPAGARDAQLMRTIAVDPSNSSVVYAANFCCQIMKSTDGGATWVPKNTPAGSYEFNFIAVARSSSSTIYATTSAGVLKSTDSGETWTFVNSGLGDLNLMSIAVSPTDPDKVYVGVALGSGMPVFGTNNGGTSWTAASVGLPASADVRKLLFDPTSGNRLWAATSQGFYIGVTLTVGSTEWLQAVNVTTSAIQDMAVNNTGTRLYVASFSTLWRSTDKGSTWTARTTSGLKDFIQAIGVEPLTGDVVYAASYARGVRKSTDGGVSFANPTIPSANAFLRGMSVGTDTRVHIAVENLNDIFVTQLNETGTGLQFSTYLGGSEADSGHGVATDPDGNIYAAAEVNSSGFPTTSSALRRDRIGTEGAVLKIGPGTPACSVSAFVGTPVFASAGGSTHVSVVAPSGCAWNATTAADWIVIHRAAGDLPGSGGFYVTVKDNVGITPRSGMINIAGAGGSTSVSITQVDGVSCPYTVSSNFSSYLAGGGADSFSVVTLPGCPWALINSTNWIQTTPTSGSGPASISLTVAPNPSPVIRTFNLSYGPFSHLVQQAPGCAYVLNPASLAVLPVGGPQVVNVYAPAGCNWSVTSSPSWITVNSGSGTGNGVINVTVLPNHAGSARASLLGIGFRSIAVTQSPATCTYSLSAGAAPDQTKFGGPISVNIITSPGCAWNARSLATWALIDGADSVSGRTGTGPTTLNMFVLGNPERNARVGNLTIAGQNYSVNQAAGSPVLASTAYVQNLYFDLLGRSPEAAGVNYWVSQLNARTQTREQTAGAFFNAPEFGDTAQFVINVYLGLLVRDPDFVGWNYWMGQLRTGQTRLQMVTAVMAAPEVAAIYDPLSNSDFVNALYVNLLGRTAAPAEIAFWLGTGLSRPEIALQFLESAEFKDRFRKRALANACYLGFLRRGGEPAGLDYWVVFQATGTTADLVAGFVNSTEYLNRPFGAR